MGEYTVTELFEDKIPLFTVSPQMGNEAFQFRFRLQEVKIFKQLVEIKPLITEPGFVTNKTMWSGQFRQAMWEIPRDYRTIVGTEPDSLQSLWSQE